jgi:hypothetical protein
MEKMRSLAIRFPAAPLAAAGLQTGEPPDGCRASHWFGCGGEAGVLVLSQLFYRAGNEWTRTYSLDRADEPRFAPLPLPALTAALVETDLWPICLAYFGDGVWGVGAAKNVIMPIGSIRCGLFLFDLGRLDEIRFFPNVGSRFAVQAGQPVASTVHHNCESRHSVTLDDGVCRWLEFDAGAKPGTEPGRCRLLALTDSEFADDFPVGFPALDESRQAPSLMRQVYADPDRRAALRARIGVPESLLDDAQLFRGMGLRTDHVAPLPTGGILCSLWSTG